MDWPLVGREATLADAFDLIDGGVGVALLGPAGVGKSRLLAELAKRAESEGTSVVRAVATETTGSIPFAPFIELLPTKPTPNLLAMLAEARMSLDTLGGNDTPLIAIDDARHLDTVSLSFIVSVVASRIATVAMTARSGEPIASDLVDLWTNGAIRRIDVGPLDERGCHELVTRVLEGPATERLESELWRLSRGNPLVLHELLEGAVGSSVTRADDAWDLDGSIASSPRLADLVTSRLAAIPDHLRGTLDVVAVGAPMPYPVARHAVAETLPELERRNLVRVIGGTTESTVVPGHPLHGEVLAAHMSASRRRSAHRTLLNAALSEPGQIDPLRVALWQRDAGEMRSVDVALAGAQAALNRHDPGLCEDLIAALDDRDDRVALLLGRALSYQQQFERAEQALAGRWPDNDHLLTELASIRSQNMGFGLESVVEAREILERAAGAVRDPDLRARLSNERAMVSAISGDFEDTMAVTHAVLGDPGTSASSRAAAYVGLTVALSMTGDVDGIGRHHRDALTQADLARDVLPFARDQIEVMYAAAEISAGRLDDALVICDTALDRSGRGNALTPTWLACSCMALIPMGRLTRARSAIGRALDLFERADPFGLHRQALGVAALIQGQMGESTAIGEVELVGLTPRFGAWRFMGAAWAAAADGRPEDGALIAAEGGRLCSAGQHYAWAMFCFHSAARLGRPDVVVDDAAAIDTSRGAAFLEAMQTHIRALVSGDHPGVGKAGDRFAALGANLLAADCHAQASTAMLEVGLDRLAARHALLSMIAERRCEHAWTPAFDARPSLVSDREIEIAVDASAGMTSREIAEKRFISARTVDNHLRSIYRKLDLGGREELSSLLERVP